MKKIMVVLLALIAIVRSIVYFFSYKLKGKQNEEALFKSESKKPSPESTGDKVDINLANHEELLSIPGIGDDLAGKIIHHRDEHGEFPTKNELKQVSGIGERKFEQIQDYIHCSNKSNQTP